MKKPVDGLASMRIIRRIEANNQPSIKMKLSKKQIEIMKHLNITEEMIRDAKEQNEVYGEGITVMAATLGLSHLELGEQNHLVEKICFN